MSLVATFFESTASAYQAAIGRDSLGGVTQDFTPGDPNVVTLFSNWPCSYQEASVQVKTLYAQRNAHVDVSVYFSSNPNVEPNDLMIVKRLGSCGDTISLQVQHQRDPIFNGSEWVWVVDCERTRQPEVRTPQ